MQEQKWAIDVPYIDYIFSVIATRRWESSAEQHEERERGLLLSNTEKHVVAYCFVSRKIYTCSAS